MKCSALRSVVMSALPVVAQWEQTSILGTCGSVWFKWEADIHIRQLGAE
jgi:hypothetical protein